MQIDLPIIAVILLGFTILFIFLNKKLSSSQKQQLDPTLLEWIKSMNQTVSSNSQNMTRALQENSRQLYERLEKTAQALQEVNKEVGKMSEIGRSMQELQEFLKSPKLRGNIGEQVLKDLISQIFPKNSFHLQYAFKSGEKVDAAIKTDAGILCIDSKFPMENFQKMTKHSSKDAEYIALQKEFSRDVKKHIESIARKYILPEEGTMDFALMYVPSEAVFYEIVNMDELIEFARKERIYIVSPSTLYAHLQTILLSFEGKKIESRSKEVFRLLRALQTDYGKVNDSLDLLGKHLGNASNQYANVSKSFSLLGQKLSSSKQIEDKMEEDLLED